MTTATVTTARDAEHTIASWLLSIGWAIVLGAASGAACIAVRLFFHALQWIFVRQTGMLPIAAAALSSARRILIPVIGAALAMFVARTMRSSHSEQHFEEYVEAIRFRKGRIPLVSTIWRTASSAFSGASGSAIGREGSMIQFAAAICSWIGERSSLRSLPLSRQVAYGAAAAVAAVYQAPIAGVFFAMEIILDEWTWSDVPCLLFATSAGWLTSRLFLGAGRLFPVAQPSQIRSTLLSVFLLSVAMGAIGPAYQKLLKISKVAKRLPFAMLWSGLAVGLLALIEPKVWGNGDAALLAILQNKTMPVATLIVLTARLVATTFCVGTGTVGGVFTPTLFTGAALGLVAGHLSHSPEPVVLALCGMGFLLAAVTHAPLMAATMAVALTGQWRLLPIILVCCLLSTFVARTISHESLYAIASPEPAQ